MVVFAQGATPPVPTTAIWQWDTTSSQIPIVKGFPSENGFSPTKTGLTPEDLENFVGVPLQYYGNPPEAVNPGDIINWIRYAEDRIEQKTSILLCQTWVASPPSPSAQVSQNLGLVTISPNGNQVRGIDYDLEDAPYDFMFNRAQDSGWMYQVLRYRPVQSLTYNASGSGPGFGTNSAATTGPTGVKNVAFIYPLLNVFTRIPGSWIVEDRNFGLVRLVPAVNVQMLPLYSMQLAFMGFSENVPGAQWYQYTAGLTPFDYRARFSFMKELVLCEAALTALTAIQAGISMGAESYRTLIDGLQWQVSYPKEGPFGPILKQFERRRDKLLELAQAACAGPYVGVL